MQTSWFLWTAQSSFSSSLPDSFMLSCWLQQFEGQFRLFIATHCTAARPPSFTDLWWDIRSQKSIFSFLRLSLFTVFYLYLWMWSTKKAIKPRRSSRTDTHPLPHFFNNSTSLLQFWVSLYFHHFVLPQFGSQLYSRRCKKDIILTLVLLHPPWSIITFCSLREDYNLSNLYSCPLTHPSIIYCYYIIYLPFHFRVMVGHWCPYPAVTEELSQVHGHT